MTRLAACLAALALACPAPAQSPAPPARDSSSRTREAARPAIDAGSFDGTTYRNTAFGLTCQVPYGWVDRTASMQQDSEPGKSQVLLAVFERPPEATTAEVNAAIVIAAESAASYPALKTAADYFGPIAELAAARGFTASRDPYDFALGAARVVREDFERRLPSQTTYQSSLVFLKKKYIVSVTVLGASEDEVEERIAGVHLGAAMPPQRKK